MDVEELTVGLHVELDGQHYVITSIDLAAQQVTLHLFNAAADIGKRIDYRGTSKVLPLNSPIWLRD